MSEAEVRRIIEENLGTILLIWLFVIVPVAFWIHRDAKRRGARATRWTVLWCTVGWILIPLGAIAVLATYLVRRPKLAPLPVGSQASSWAQPSPPSAGSPERGEPSPAQGSLPAPPPVWGQGYQTGRVKCPRCQTVFEYQRPAQGVAHVKCGACGLEGTI